MNYQQITIAVSDLSVQEILIACLSEAGYEGFEEGGNFLHAFIPDPNFNAVLLEEMLSPWQLTYTSQFLEEKNWNEEWEKNFQPVIVEDFCAVRAHFHAPIPGVQHDLLITPKMSFGTGHHATTYMMMQMMRSLPFAGRQVLDFGTGTGVLAILAEKLSASGVLAIDNDDWSINNAIENIEKNNSIKVEVEKMDKIPDTGGYDIILANINKHILMREMASLGQHLNKNGVILMSGLLDDDFDDIEKEALINKLSVSGRISKGHWTCLQLQKKGENQVKK